MVGTVNVIERVLSSGSKYFQYDFRVELPDGRIYRERRKARGATTQAAARQLGLRRLQEVLKAGPKPRSGPDSGEMPTVAQFASEWLKLCRAERQKPATIENKEHVLKNHILPLIGRLRLDEVREATISKIKRERSTLAPSTVNFILKHVIALLHSARSEGYKIEIPTCKRLPEPRSERWYPPDEYDLLVRSAATFGPGSLVLVLLGGDAGLRSGEICGLRWEDVDFRGGVLTVRRNLVRKREGSPKTGREREVPLTRRLTAALQDLHREEGRAGRFGRVLTRLDGKDMNADLLKDVLGRVTTYAGVPYRGLHALRHSFGSRLLLNGVGAQVAMMLLGHTNLRTTQLYAHANPEHCRQAILRLEE